MEVLTQLKEQCSGMRAKLRLGKHVCAAHLQGGGGGGRENAGTVSKSTAA